MNWLRWYQVLARFLPRAESWTLRRSQHCCSLQPNKAEYWQCLEPIDRSVCRSESRQILFRFHGFGLGHLRQSSAADEGGVGRLDQNRRSPRRSLEHDGTPVDSATRQRRSNSFGTPSGSHSRRRWQQFQRLCWLPARGRCFWLLILYPTIQDWIFN